MVSEVEWRVIPGFEKYSISNDGHIRNNVTGRILKTVRRPDGRLQIVLYDGSGNGRCFYIHKLVFDIFNNETGGKYIKHIDGDRSNNRIDNLIASNKPSGSKGRARMKRERKVRDVLSGQIYKSERECVLAIGGTTSGLWCCLNGYTKTYKGCRYEYAD